jgi:hypothetical protein
MHKTFYIGHKDGGHNHNLDVAPFTSLEQLTRTLAEIFAFADPKCAFLLSSQELEEHSCRFIVSVSTLTRHDMLSTS